MRWERIAVVTNVEWIRHAVRAFRFLMPGAVKIFSIDEKVMAREWFPPRTHHELADRRGSGSSWLTDKAVEPSRQ